MEKAYYVHICFNIVNEVMIYSSLWYKYHLHP